MKTTLNKIRAHAPCKDGWEKLLRHLGKTTADDEPLAITTIIDSNGLDDALWCLRAVDGYDKEIRLFAVWCARQVQHLMTDQRSHTALDVAERFAHGLATRDELAAAWDAARGAAEAASVAASFAASVARAAGAAGAAASVAASVAARAARAAGAAGVAARVAASVAASVAAMAAQEKELRRICVAIEAATALKSEPSCSLNLT